MNNAVNVSKSQLKVLLQYAEGQVVDEEDLVAAIYDLNLSIELREKLQIAEANSYTAPAPTPNNVQDGWVIGTVSTGYVGSRAEFRVCTVEAWSEMSEEESNKAVAEAAWESIDVGA
jgi:hypothetical protein